MNQRRWITDKKPEEGFSWIEPGTQRRANKGLLLSLNKLHEQTETQKTVAHVESTCKNGGLFALA